MKWSVEIPVSSINEPMFRIPKGFRFVYHSSSKYFNYYYRWPLNYLVKLYIKLYYWYLMNFYVRTKKTIISKR